MPCHYQRLQFKPTLLFSLILLFVFFFFQGGVFEGAEIVRHLNRRNKKENQLFPYQACSPWFGFNIKLKSLCIKHNVSQLTNFQNSAPIGSNINTRPYKKKHNCVLTGDKFKGATTSSDISNLRDLIVILHGIQGAVFRMQHQIVACVKACLWCIK